MMRAIYFILLLLFFYCRVSAQDTFQLWKRSEYLNARSTQNANYLTEDEKLVIYYTNLVRMNPKGFANTYLNAYVEYKKLDKKEEYVRSLYEDLNKWQSLEPLKPSKKLSNAALEHAKYMGQANKIGHIGKNNSTVKDRLGKFLENGVGWYGENCDYGNHTALEVVIKLLLDKSVKGYGHRYILLSDKPKYLGVGIAPHKKYKKNCVMDFSTSIKDE